MRCLYPAGRVALSIAIVLLLALMLTTFGQAEGLKALQVAGTPTTRLETDVDLATEDAVQGNVSICDWFTTNEQGRQIWLCPIFPFVTPGATTMPAGPPPAR